MNARERGEKKERKSGDGMRGGVVQRTCAFADYIKNDTGTHPSWWTVS